MSAQTASQKVVAAFKANPGWNSIQIAKHLRCKPGFVRHVLRANGFQVVRHSSWTADRIAQLLSLYEADVPLRKIAEALELPSTYQVSSKLQQMKVPPRAAIAPAMPIYVSRNADFERVLREQQDRLFAPPRDLTGAILGDPPRGFSALEARR